MKNQTSEKILYVTKRDFGMKCDGDYIQGERFKDKYIAYQSAYQQQYGVLPEFDQINCPFTAISDDVYYFYRSLEKRGITGALVYHDIHGFINKKYKRLYYEYQKEWSFIFGFDSSIVEKIEMRMNNTDQEHIENGLGYKSEDGIYYEGTWENGRLVYGLMYSHDVFFVGKIEYRDYDNQILYHGVQVAIAQQGKADLMEIGCGTFYMRNNSMVPYTNEALAIVGSTKDGISMKIASYVDGYEHGKMYIKNFDHGEITVSVGIMKDGGLKRDVINPFFKMVHSFMAIYMIAYYFMKYTYGLLIFPFYRMYRKKHWK